MFQTALDASYDVNHSRVEERDFEPFISDTEKYRKEKVLWEEQREAQIEKQIQEHEAQTTDPLGRDRFLPRRRHLMSKRQMDQKKVEQDLRLSDPELKDRALQSRIEPGHIDFTRRTGRKNDNFFNQQQPQAKNRLITSNIGFHIPIDTKPKDKGYVHMQKMQGRNYKWATTTEFANLDYSSQEMLKSMEMQQGKKRLDTGVVPFVKESKRRELFVPGEAYPWLADDPSINSRQFPSNLDHFDNINYTSTEADPPYFPRLDKVTSREVGRFGSPYKKLVSNALFYDKRYNHIERKIARNCDLYLNIGRDNGDVRNVIKNVDTLLSRIDEGLHRIGEDEIVDAAAIAHQKVNEPHAPPRRPQVRSKSSNDLHRRYVPGRHLPPAKDPPSPERLRQYNAALQPLLHPVLDSPKRQVYKDKFRPGISHKRAMPKHEIDRAAGSMLSRNSGKLSNTM